MLEKRRAFDAVQETMRESGKAARQIFLYGKSVQERSRHCGREDDQISGPEKAEAFLFGSVPDEVPRRHACARPEIHVSFPEEDFHHIEQRKREGDGSFLEDPSQRMSNHG